MLNLLILSGLQEAGRGGPGVEQAGQDSLRGLLWSPGPGHSERGDERRPLQRVRDQAEPRRHAQCRQELPGESSGSYQEAGVTR